MDMQNTADDARLRFIQVHDDTPAFDPLVTTDAWNSQADILFYLQSKVAYVDIPGNTYIVKYRKGDDTVFEFQPRETVKAKLAMFQFTYRDGVDARGDPQIFLYKGEQYMRERGFTTFHKIIFDPDDKECATDANKTCFNSYKGMAFTPEEDFVVDNDKIAPFVNHITRILCDNDRELSAWLLAWLANIIQHPGTKSGCCCLFRSRQGTGKSFFFKLYGKLLGPDLAVTIDTKDQLIGKFNDVTANKLLITADEVMFGGEHAASNKIKSLITSETTILEKKYMNKLVVKSCERYVFLSNEKWPLRVEVSDRRTACFEVSPAQANNQEYFTYLDEFYDQTALKHLFHFFHRHRPEGDAVALRMFPPSTRMKTTLQSFTRSDYERFIIDLLDSDNGCEMFDIVDGEFVTCKNFLEMYREWAGVNGRNTNAASVSEIASTFAHMLPKRRRRVNAAMLTGFVWDSATLKTCLQYQGPIFNDEPL